MELLQNETDLVLEGLLRNASEFDASIRCSIGSTPDAGAALSENQKLSPETRIPISTS
jgi:hypothetical protein